MSDPVCCEVSSRSTVDNGSPVEVQPSCVEVATHRWRLTDADEWRCRCARHIARVSEDCTVESLAVSR